MMLDCSARLHTVMARIRTAEMRFQRPIGSVRLLAVSKTQSAAAIAAVAALGQKSFGESYLQETLMKRMELYDLNLEWHFVGSIQSNKTRDIAKRFDWVHSVDRLKIAERLNMHRPNGLPPLNICLQLKTSNDPNIKHGLDCADLAVVAKKIVSLPRIRLRGLMAISNSTDECINKREFFARIRKLYERLVSDGLRLDTLSMGMSNDLEAAIAEGSTLVRIGTAIFGSRF
jgi:pyridoxal phosphate enzyme (YggS family)